FFWNEHLWKQFIAFNAENPVFAGKTFDDFADIIQKRYGPAAMTFRKLRTSDEQTLDHLEWPPAGDHVLWAVDLTTFYGNFCLSLMQKSRIADLDSARKVNSPKHVSSNALVDAVMHGEAAGKKDANEDVVDDIVGHPMGVESGPHKPASQSSVKKGAKLQSREPEEKKAADPLEGTNF